MILKLNVVFGHHNPKAFLELLDLHQLQYFLVVLGHFGSQCVRRNVDDINVGVMKAKNARDLGVLSLFVVAKRFSFLLLYAKRIDMDLHAALRLYLGPALLEFLLHLAPDAHRLLFEALDLNLG